MNTIHRRPGSFFLYLLNRDKSPKTILGYAADLKQVEKYLGGSLAQLTADDVRRYRNHL